MRCFDALARRAGPHPLGHHSSGAERLSAERQLIAPIRKLADVVIDTSRFNVHELRQFITRRFQSSEQQTDVRLAW